jgi:uncharacterized protein (TIGR02118 family)
MIKVSVMYPNQPGKTFDMDYYLKSHMPMVKARLADACKGMSVDQGIGGAEPGAPAAYMVIGHILFDSVEAFQSAFGQHAAEFLADIPNYTAIEPVLQVSEVKL